MHRAGLVAQLPVAIVDGRHGSGAHNLLQVITLQGCDLSHSLLKAGLDFGQSWDRHPNRQVVVQNMIFAQIGMGQHKISKTLRIAQTGAVPHHDPGVRAQYGYMIGGGFGIRRANADIHQSDAAAIGSGQVVGWHLRHFLRRLQGASAAVMQ